MLGRNILEIKDKSGEICGLSLYRDFNISIFAWRNRHRFHNKYFIGLVGNIEDINLGSSDYIESIYRSSNFSFSRILRFSSRKIRSLISVSCKR